MKRLEEQTHYEVLEVEPGASAEEIRAAYERLRKLLGPGSLAVYSLVDPAEQEALLLRCDEAFTVLRDPAARRAYDVSLGLAEPEPETPPAHASFAEAVTAIERSAEGYPAEAEAAGGRETEARLAEAAAAGEGAGDGPAEEVIALDDDDVLEVVELGGVDGEVPRWGDAPAGAVPAASRDAVAEPPAAARGGAEGGPRMQESRHPSVAPTEPRGAEPGAAALVVAEPLRAVPSAGGATARTAPRPDEAALPSTDPPATAVSMGGAEADLPTLDPETVFTGDLLRRIRLARGLTLEQIAARTRIGTGHLENLEAERWELLPERVFLRGFLVAYARELRLDANQVCRTYLERAERRIR